MNTEPLKSEPLKLKTPYVYAGQFAFYKQEENEITAVQWVGCRDGFSSMFKKPIESFLFSHAPNVGPAIQAFLNKFEKLLKLKKNRTTVLPTTCNTVSLIEVPLWWRKYFCRRQLYTILLRSAQTYKIDVDNFQDSLFSNQYANQTKEAIEYFLKGNTFAKRENFNAGGWWCSFTKVGSYATNSRKRLDEILAKPPKKPVVPVEAPVATTQENPVVENPVVETA